MPQAAKRFNAQPPRQHRPDTRPSARQRGYTHVWELARERYLADHPLCVECFRDDRLTPATVVDHVIPHRGDAVLFWDESNWQSLCTTCHNRKTRRGQ
jgi:5-methylcytosine-specific restriction enzyme A